MSAPTLLHRAAIAIGSNLGDRFRNIELALRFLEEPDRLITQDTSSPRPARTNAIANIIDTSFMYETAPMYVTDQPAFINCACVVETDLEPLTLLDLLKAVEEQVGRVPSIRYGPRAVDLDIVFFDDAVIDTRPREERDRLDNLVGELVVPHPRLIEREFVLRPLNDMIPDHEHPILGKTVRSLLSELPVNADAQPMLKVIPFPRHPISDPVAAAAAEASPSPYSSSIGQVPDTLTYWTHPLRTKSGPPSSTGARRRKTHVMAIINVTLDSFSDGALYNTVSAALSHACDAVAAGAGIVDVGGYSTRPGAAFVSVEQEIARVEPVIDAIRQGRINDAERDGEGNEMLEQEGKLKDVIISVDTFRPEVAEVAILKGANCINDVYAFMGPEWWQGESSERLLSEAEGYLRKMKETARKNAVPVILMHSRGEAGKNKDYSKYSYADEAVIEGVRIELGEKVERVVKGKGGLRRWMVIIDVGVGFSKTVEGNTTLLRNAAKVIADVPVGAGLPKRNPLAGFPQLIGPSRKSFLGLLLAEGDQGRKTEPKERTWATAAAVACSVQQEALLVRVHDVHEMMDVVRVSDAIWNCD